MAIDRLEQPKPTLLSRHAPFCGMKASHGIMQHLPL